MFCVVLVCCVDDGKYCQSRVPLRMLYTSPSYSDSACTIDGSDLEPSLNSSIDNLPSAFCIKQVILKKNVKKRPRFQDLSNTCKMNKTESQIFDTNHQVKSSMFLR